VYVTCTPSEVIRTISTGVPAGKVGELEVPQVKVTLAGVLGGITVVLTVVALPLVEVVVIVTVVRGVEHIRVPFVNSSSAVAMETVGLPGGL
jgi:hypothetical protein